jgi:hypothetical protein
MLKCVEGNQAGWTIKLASQELGDDSFEVHSLYFGFTVDDPACAEAAHNAIKDADGSHRL